MARVSKASKRAEIARQVLAEWNRLGMKFDREPSYTVFANEMRAFALPLMQAAYDAGYSFSTSSDPVWGSAANCMYDAFVSAQRSWEDEQLRKNYVEPVNPGPGLYLIGYTRLQSALKAKDTKEGSCEVMVVVPEKSACFCIPLYANIPAL